MARPHTTLASSLKSNLPSGARLLVAVSGGRDSMALLHAAAALARQKKLHLEVAHVNHGLRAEAGSDAVFVRAAAKAYGLHYHHKKCAAKPRKANLEAWGREQRYSFFEAVRVKRDLDFVVTAHTADDVAETLLMRLVSNKELRTIERFDMRRHLLRPLLEVTRAEVNAFVARHALEYREDETNRDTSYLRNRVRLKLLPILESEFDRRIVETLSERARALDDDARFLDKLAKQTADKIAKTTFGTKAWLTGLKELLRGLDPALKWRAVQVALLPKLGFNLGRSKCIEMVGLIEGSSVGIELPGGVRFRRSKGELHQIY